MPNIIWLKDGRLVQTELNDRFSVIEEIVPGFVYDLADTLKSTLTILNLSERDGGSYLCRAVNGFRSAAVLQQPYHLTIPHGKNQGLNKHTTMIVVCTLVFIMASSVEVPQLFYYFVH